jgi:hypothetical protein
MRKDPCFLIGPSYAGRKLISPRVCVAAHVRAIDLSLPNI